MFVYTIWLFKNVCNRGCIVLLLRVYMRRMLDLILVVIKIDIIQIGIWCCYVSCHIVQKKCKEYENRTNLPTPVSCTLVVEIYLVGNCWFGYCFSAVRCERKFSIQSSQFKESILVFDIYVLKTTKLQS